MSKTVVEDCKKVQMWWLKKHGYLRGLTSGGIEWTNSFNENKSSIGFTISTFECYIRFHYTQTDNFTDEVTNMDYKFSLGTTPCNYGGLRYWFICGLSRNGRHCGRRVAKLYKPPGAKWFGCRHCWDLSYDERQKNRNGKYSTLFRTLNLTFKAERLAKNIKRWYWQGKPTRKYSRLLKYCYLTKRLDYLAENILTC